MESARCWWEVQAGIILGEPLPEYTRRWGLTNIEWESPQGVALYNAAWSGPWSTAAI